MIYGCFFCEIFITESAKPLHKLTLLAKPASRIIVVRGNFRILFQMTDIVALLQKL
jgi:hypothetical protein